MRYVILAAALMAATPALAKVPHTVDYHGEAQPMDGMDHGAMTHDTIECQNPFAAGMDKMHHDMMVKGSGDVDADFARMMIPHHQGAIDMAKAELQCGHDPKLRDLATKIVAAQEDKIAFMQSWLASHDGSR